MGRIRRDGGGRPQEHPEKQRGSCCRKVYRKGRGKDCKAKEEGK